MRFVRRSSSSGDSLAYAPELVTVARRHGIMRPLLLDEGLPPAVAIALGTVGCSAAAVGIAGAPPRGSSDHDNCAWCASQGAVLVTNDRGRKDPAIMDALAQHHVHAAFVHDDLRNAPAHYLLGAILRSEQRMDELTSRRRGLLRHRLTASGRLEPR